MSVSLDEIKRLLRFWIELSIPREGRHFLIQHPELLRPGVNWLLLTLDNPIKVRPYVELLSEVQQRGASELAIHDAYVNRHGGLALDLPDWLAEMEPRLLEKDIPLLREALVRVSSDPAIPSAILAALQSLQGEAFKGHQTTEKGPEEIVLLHTHALTVYTRERYPKQFARQHNLLGNCYQTWVGKEYPAHLEHAISCYNVALSVYTHGDFPLEYVLVNHNLGCTYEMRLIGDTVENREQAILCWERALDVPSGLSLSPLQAIIHYRLGYMYQARHAGERSANQEKSLLHCEEALRFYRSEIHAEYRAATHYNLGLVYSHRVLGHVEDNLEMAIRYFQEALKVYTYEAQPVEWALAEYNLGFAYYKRISGEQSANWEQAIACYHATLQVYTRDSYPGDWAMVHNSLGVIYRKRQIGEKHVNREKAIYCYQSALQIYTPAAFPVEWAMVQNNLGNAYSEHLEINASENSEQALAHYTLALQVSGDETSPESIAITHYHLGMIYAQRKAGIPADNIEQSLEHYQMALLFYTREHTPYDWAAIHTSMGVLYYQRKAETKRDNLEQAIFCHEAALQVYQLKTFPEEWASTQSWLGNAYQERLAGEQESNIEWAITCYQSALQVYSRTAQPIEWARTQQNLGSAYARRIADERSTNQEAALTSYDAALQVYTREAFPLEWASVHHNKGNVYLYRISEELRANQEQAITCYEAALQVYTLSAHPFEWATTSYNLGVAYYERLAGNRSTNLEQSINHYQSVLQIMTKEAFPDWWAKTQNGLGVAYQAHTSNLDQRHFLEQALTYYQACLDVYTQETFPKQWAQTQLNLGVAYYVLGIAAYTGRSADLEEAFACCEKALSVYTRRAFPFDWALTHYNLGNIYLERADGARHLNLLQGRAHYRCALEIYTFETFPMEYRRTYHNLIRAEIALQNWEAAHQAYTKARAAEDLLLPLGAGAVGRDIILGEASDTAVSDGFALLQLGQIGKAAVAIELGRTRGLREALMLDTSNPTQIKDTGRRMRYTQAREAMISTQAALNSPLLYYSETEQRNIGLQRSNAYHQAVRAFHAIVAEIREAQDPLNFLDDAIDEQELLQTAERFGAGHALVYLAATPWGGIALAVLSSTPTHARPCFVALDLPLLTSKLVYRCIETCLDDERKSVVGGYLHALERNGWGLLRKQWAGGTLREVAEALHQVSPGCCLDLAAQSLLAAPELSHMVDIPFGQLDASPQGAQLASTFEHYYLRVELCQCLETLDHVVIHPVTTWLQEQGVTSLTLIPCGPLAAFPLTTLHKENSLTPEHMLPTSIALSACSLWQEKVLNEDEEKNLQRAGVYALGDPRPTLQELPWSEAEAHTLVKIAQQFALPAQARVHQAGGRVWLDKALQRGYVVNISCHGKFSTGNFLQSSLQLAKGQRFTLAEALSHKVDLRELRLLILSACQSATLDLRGARDEVRSLAAGMIQAGARAVLAALWSVDDKATYLLITRFAQEWFPHMDHGAPAAALLRAQSWLRTVTNRELQQWRISSMLEATIAEKQQAGSLLPQRNVWEEAPIRAPELVAVRGRGNRYEITEAEKLIYITATGQEAQDACPYAHPIYWAGFQLMGW